jgi:hypothetical protein
MQRYIRDCGVTHRNMVEDIDAGYIPREYGFQIQIATQYGREYLTETRWVSYDTDGAYIIWSSMWADNRFIQESDLTDSEICQIESMIDSHLDTLCRELAWAEEYI